MHELAVCHVGAAQGSAVGYVEQYDSGVLVAHLNTPLAEQHIGDAVQVIVLDPVRGECRYTGLIGGLTDEEVTIVVEELVEQNQRRSAARADYEASSIARRDRDPNGKAIRLSIVDISASGIRFACPTELAVGEVVRFSLPVDGDTIDVRASVLRIEDARSGARYGCEFLGLDNRTREILFRLVLRLQREQARARADRRAFAV